MTTKTPPVARSVKRARAAQYAKLSAIAASNATSAIHDAATAVSQAMRLANDRITIELLRQIGDKLISAGWNAAAAAEHAAQAGEDMREAAANTPHAARFSFEYESAVHEKNTADAAARMIESVITRAKVAKAGAILAGATFTNENSEQAEARARR